MEMSLFHKNPKHLVYLIQREEGNTHTQTGTRSPCRRTISLHGMPVLANEKHLYSKATWPLVIAAAFFVPVTLRHPGLTQHIALTSPRHSATVKVKRPKEISEIIDLTDGEERLADGGR